METKPILRRILIASFALAGLSLAACGKSDDERFTEMTGVWTDQTNPITVKLTGEDKYLVIATPQFVPLGGPPEIVLAAKVTAIDIENDVYSLALTPDPRNDVTRTMVGDGSQTTTLRQVWDAPRENFTLTMTMPDGRQFPLSFVRRLTQADLRQIPQATAAGSAPPAETATSKTAASPATLQVTGEYRYTGSECCDGLLQVTQSADGKYDVLINTVTRADQRVCYVEKEGLIYVPRSEAEGSLTWIEEDGQCGVGVFLGAGGAEVASNGDSCTQLCGSGAHFDGQYVRK